MKLSLIDIQATADLVNNTTRAQVQELAAIIKEVRTMYHSFYYSTSPNRLGIARTPSGVVTDWLEAPQLCLDNYQEQDTSDNREDNYQALVALGKIQEYLRCKISNYRNINELIFESYHLSSIKDIRKHLENSKIFDDSLENATSLRI